MEPVNSKVLARAMAVPPALQTPSAHREKLCHRGDSGAVLLPVFSALGVVIAVLLALCGQFREAAVIFALTTALLFASLQNMANRQN